VPAKPPISAIGDITAPKPGLSSCPQRRGRSGVSDTPIATGAAVAAAPRAFEECDVACGDRWGKRCGEKRCRVAGVLGGLAADIGAPLGAPRRGAPGVHAVLALGKSLSTVLPAWDGIGATVCGRGERPCTVSACHARNAPAMDEDAGDAWHGGDRGPQAERSNEPTR